MGMTLICCSKEKEKDDNTEIKQHEEKPPVTAYRYSYAYATTPCVVQQQPPLYHESMSQTPTVINH